MKPLLSACHRFRPVGDTGRCAFEDRPKPVTGALTHCPPRPGALSTIDESGDPTPPPDRRGRRGQKGDTVDLSYDVSQLCSRVAALENAGESAAS